MAAALLVAVCALNWPGMGPEDIVVGYSADLTGRMSELGISGRNGIQTAIDEANAAGGINGRSIRLIVKDDRNDPQASLECDKSLVAQGAVAIIGHMVSGTMRHSLPYVNKTNVLMISPTVSSRALSHRDDHFCRTIDTNARQAERLAEFAAKAGVRRIAAIYESKNAAYSGELYQCFRRRFEHLGGTVVMTLDYASGENVDFAEKARRLADSGADGVLSVASGLDNAMLCQQLRRRGSDLPVFSGMWSMTSDLLTNGGSAVEKVVLAGTFDRFDLSPRYRAFKRLYQSRYRVEPDFGAVYGYETAMALIKAMKLGPTLKADDLKRNLTAIGKFKGLQGDFSIDAYGDCTRPYLVFEVRDGEFRRIANDREQAQPQY